MLRSFGSAAPGDEGVRLRDDSVETFVDGVERVGVGRKRSLMDARGGAGMSGTSCACWVSFGFPRKSARSAPELFLSDKTGVLRPSAATASPAATPSERCWRAFCSFAASFAAESLKPKFKSSVEGRRSRSAERRILRDGCLGGSGAARVVPNGREDVDWTGEYSWGSNGVGVFRPPPSPVGVRERNMSAERRPLLDP